MSSDNYYVVREVGKLWYVTMGFASDDEEPVPDLKTDPCFDYGFDAMNYAQREYSEYGAYAAEPMAVRQVKWVTFWRNLNWRVRENWDQFKQWWYFKRKSSKW